MITSTQEHRMGPYIYEFHTEGGWMSLEICHVFVDSVVSKQQIYCLFLWMVGVGGGVKKLVIGHKWMTPMKKN